MLTSDEWNDGRLQEQEMENQLRMWFCLNNFGRILSIV